MSRMNLRFKYMVLGLFILIVSNDLSAQRNPDRLNYIEKYKDIAIKEMERAGIPASIKLAQAILESNAGKSVLARKANNHFGIKCGSQWKGKTFFREDDDYDNEGNLMKSCFRVYRNIESSFVAHSEFLRDPRKDYRYGFLFRLEVTDYRRWALGLKKAGYATNPHYPDLLISIIEDYELYVYDNMTGNDILLTPPDLPPSATFDIVLVNDIKTVLAKEGETPATVAERANVSLRQILRYNEGLQPNDPLLDGHRVFLQPKRTGFRGKKKYHYVKTDEDMMTISQLYGVKLESLHKRNRISLDREPKIGERIKLRGWKVSKRKIPKTRSAKQEQEDIPPATLPVRDLEQDPELDFDPTIPSTSIDDFEVPDFSDPATTTTTEEEEGDFLFEDDFVEEDTTIEEDESAEEEDVFIEEEEENEITEEEDDIIEEEEIEHSAPDPRARYYTVKDGDTLYRISKRFDITVLYLKQLNGLASNLIRVGQELRIK